MPEWTREQRLAIEARDGGVLVAAAAGSGKTTVLVERIITLLTDEEHPVPADRILAVTFTNAAAASVSARLKKALYQRILQDPDNLWLRRQRLLLARAQISTVHSFCSALLREHFNALDIPADFTICDALSAETLREQALDAAMGSMYAEADSGIRALADLFGRARSDRETAELIRRLYDFESNLAFPKQWQAACLAAQEEGISLPDSAVGRFLWHQAEIALASAKSICEQILRLCDTDADLTIKYAPAVQKDLDGVEALLQLCGARRWDDARRFLLTFSHAGLLAAKKADPAAREQAKAMRESVKDIFKALKTQVFTCYEDAFQAEKAVHTAALRVLFEAVDRFGRQLFELKQKRRAFEFSDLERLTVQLLCEENGAPTPLAAEIASRYDHILVDEYQDTNEMQDLIFSRISQKEKNLFFVGDVKQSIYSFRRADPDIFVGRKDACFPAQSGRYPMCVPLRNNFRSSRAVIDGINAVFAPIMRRETGGADYTGDEQLAAYDGSDARDPLGLCLHMVQSEETADEAQMVADIIARHLNEGTLVAGETGLRPCRPGDFCILLRSTGCRELYAGALAAAGIPAWRDSGDKFFDHSEVSVILSLLRVMDNPRRDVDLCAVMLSPLFGFTPEEAARLRLEKRQGSFYSAVLASENERCRAFVQRLGQLRRDTARMGLARAVRYAVDATDAEILLCAGAEYDARCRNVRGLIDYAAQFEAAAGGTLPAFLAVCERARKNGKSPVSDTFSPPADAVPIISVHRSKGLEWPFVIVANADKGFNLKDASESGALFDAGLGAGLRFKRESAGGMVGVQTLAYRALSRHSVARTKSEEMRVLYVALTRAKQRVYVTAKTKNAEKLLTTYSILQPDDHTVSTRNSFLGWLLLAFAANGAGQAFFRADSAWQRGALGYTVQMPCCSQAVEQQQASANADMELAQRINTASTFVYKKKAFETVPAKLSVSRLTHQTDTMALLRPGFARGGMSGADKGSATHLFMQIADHAAAARSVEAELARLVEGEFISADMAKGVNVRELKTFFESDLAKRMLAAKEVLREYAFMDRLDAAEIADVPPGVDHVLVQGIADCIFFEADGAVLLDYKTDRVQSVAELAERYGGQVTLYRRALEKRLSVPVKQTLLYSFACGGWVEVE